MYCKNCDTPASYNEHGNCEECCNIGCRKNCIRRYKTIATGLAGYTRPAMLCADCYIQHLIYYDEYMRKFGKIK